MLKFTKMKKTKYHLSI